LNEPPAIRKTRRTVPSSRRKRHFDPGKFHQRGLFVPPAACKLVVCLDCGTAEFAVPEEELRQLAKGDPAAAG
jgi:hypothetical protein